MLSRLKVEKAWYLGIWNQPGARVCRIRLNPMFNGAGLIESVVLESVVMDLGSRSVREDRHLES